MNAAAWILVLATLGAGQDPKPAAHGTPPAPSTLGTAADAVSLRDGKVVLGQVVDTADRRGPVVVLVRRAWAERNVPDLYATWLKAEAPTLRRAETQRRDRLRAWRRDRPAVVAADDPITPWLDTEIARLDAALHPGAPPSEVSRLMAVRLPRTSIRAIDRKHRLTGRLLRLAWTLDLDDAETRPSDGLKQALEDRGFAPTGDSPASVDHLLPVPLESDAEWLTRRAATEALHLAGARFLLVGGAVLPEPAAGAAPPAGAALEAVGSTLKDLLGEERRDPLPAKFRELAANGRVGAVVTGLEMAPDLSSTTVTTTLYANPGGGRPWVAVGSRSSTGRPGDLAPDAGANLAADPQVKAAFDLVGNLGLGEIPPEMKQRSLNMGLATQQALNQARTALRDDLTRLALPLDRPHATSSGAKPTP